MDRFTRKPLAGILATLKRLGLGAGTLPSSSLNSQIAPSTMVLGLQGINLTAVMMILN